MNLQTVDSILIIIRRSNGDVLLASPLIQRLQETYAGAAIDLLVNDDTLAIAKALPHVRNIHAYSYQWKQLPRLRRLRTEAAFVGALWRRYDLAISLSTTDSSVLYALLFGRHSISAIDDEPRKSWWKKRLLDGYYRLDGGRHTLLNNLEALRLLGIAPGRIEPAIRHTPAADKRVQDKLQARGIGRFIIFHPSAQYRYKVYPEHLRHELLKALAGLGIPLVVTGARTPLDLQIKASLPVLANVHDLIGETSLDEYIALSSQALAYVGGDTLNMHIAAAQGKRVFAIFGPTLLKLWSPWSNALQQAASVSQPVQTYGNVTLFQADMPCTPCGQAGCDNRHGDSECLYRIDPAIISAEVRGWLQQQGLIDDEN
ncbi:glycosyltransferase family 9 protein [Candidatus Thiothrix sp. Deng01]|uniref:Glycosyltransferase family 9 protein n=1 Tax=Candidatus Thiothrix phosphatis TaxID=3112415 RepID=A0ABU6CWH0_9GAMM|nr:glycosyltransferase family 9 protein [Candidatus Thiothrix sp. Deng01]MEB4591180.1 glycosyltransferase family 9 protein [Candidatus Thiothrix sp. Deng01]